MAGFDQSSRGKEWAMKVVVRTFLAVIASLLFVATSKAQNAENLASAVVELRRASALLEPAHKFFRQEAFGKQPTSNEDDRADSFRKLKRAAEIFQQFAPKSIVGDVLRIAQSTFVGRRLPTPPTLIKAVEECEKRRDAQLTLLVSSTLGSFLTGAREDIEAEIAFGPIIDNLQLYGAVSPPRNGIELLRNLGFALDHDVVLRRDFYTVTNMKRFFGAEPTIYKNPNGSIRTRWILKPTEEERTNLEAGTERYAQCLYVADLIVATSGKKQGGIAIVCNFKYALGPTFEEVEQVFGQDWQDTWRMPLHGPPLPRTAPHGNSRITYDFDKGSLQRSVTVSFGPDAAFDSFELKEEEY